MKIFISIIVSITVAVFIAGCGGGGSSEASKASKVDIIVVCTTVAPASPSASDIATYHELFSGDTIVKDTVGTVVQLYTPVDSNSRVCLESGSAHILR